MDMNEPIGGERLPRQDQEVRVIIDPGLTGGLVFCTILLCVTAILLAVILS